MADGPKKTLYHGELSNMGEVEVFVAGDPMESKHKRGTFYVQLKIGGVDRTYSPELKHCVDRFRGYKNQTVRLLATGSDYQGATDADVQILGTAQNARQQSPPPQQQRQQPTSGVAQAPRQSSNEKVPIHGQTVGMAVGRACDYLMSQGKDLDSKAIHQIASDIIRVSLYLEAGNLAPKSGAKPTAPPAPVAPPTPPPAPPQAPPDDDQPPF